LAGLGAAKNKFVMKIAFFEKDFLKNNFFQI